MCVDILFTSGGTFAIMEGCNCEKAKRKRAKKEAGVGGGVVVWRNGGAHRIFQTPKLYISRVEQISVH